jgi:transcriptional regulator with XRE-family HTH domain
MIYKSAPELLTDARWKLRLQQKEIAESCGLSAAFVSDLFAGKRGLSARAAKLLGKVLKIAPRKLMIAQIDEELRGLK